MDAFEQMMKKKRRRRMLWILLLCIGIPVLLALAGYVFVFHINQFRLDVTLEGPAEMALEYGESYQEPGFSARLHGSLVMKEGREVPVSVSGHVDDRTLGTYTLHYEAEQDGWKGSADRVVHVVDTAAPRIMLRSRTGGYVIPGLEYAEEGFVARDNYDGDLTDRVVRTETKYKVTYYVEDSSGNSASVTRNIVYYDPIPPRLMMEGEESITLTVGDSYKEPGYRAEDNCDGDLTEKVQISGSVDTRHTGTYTLTYSVEDSFGNTSTATRTVKVKAKPQVQAPSSGGSSKPSTTVTPSGKVIYLTFDDGPGPYTRKLLEVLKKYNVKATFFVVNTKYVDVLADIAADGHSIGIHSACHTYKEIYGSEDAYFSDLQKMQDIIENKTGIQTTLLRFPGGSSNTVSSFNPGIMSRLTQTVEERGYSYFDWNVSSGDAGGTKDTEQVFQNVINGIQKHRVSIVLQHDIKEYSVNAVEKIIVWGLENGYTFLPLDSTSPTAHHSVKN